MSVPIKDALLSDAQLVNDLEGQGYSANNLNINGTRTGKGITTDVYISIRTDGKGLLSDAAAGTKDNPYDGSTRAKFDALLGTNGSIGADTHVHLGKGTFLTNQTKFRENLIIEGAGKYLTTVKFADGVASFAASWKVFGTTELPVHNYVSLRNLTINTNKANQPVYTSNITGSTLYGLRVRANNADIINVRLLGAWADPGEGFPLNVHHDDTVVPTDKVTFDGCDVIDPEGYLTAISSFASDVTPGASSWQIEIKNCYVQNHLGGSCFSGGFNADNSSIHNNTAYNISTGTTIDYGYHIGLRIYNNKFIKLKGKGVYMGDAPLGGLGNYTNLAIYDNYFQLDSDATGNAIKHTGTGTVTGLQIYGNTIIQQAAGNPAIKLTSTAAGSVHDNTITETTPTDLNLNAALEVSGNVTPAGAPLALKHGSAITSRQIMSATLDSDVMNFYTNAVANGGTVSATTMAALGKLVAGLKADATWTKIISFYPLCGDFAASVTKLKYPSGASPFLINSLFASGDYVETGATGGYKPDGIALKILDTSYNPVIAGASESSFGIGAYVFGTEANGTSRIIMGNQADAAGVNRTGLGWISGGSVETGTIANTSGSVGATKRDGLLVSTCNGDRVMNYYDDGVFVASAGTGSGTFVSSTIYLNASHSSGGALGPSTRYLRAAFITTGLSATDVANITTRVQAFQTALSRQVGTAAYTDSAVASLNFPSMLTATEATLTIPVLGAVTTGTPTVKLGWSAALEDGIVVKQAWVSATDTVSVRVRNSSAGTIDPAAVTCRVTVTP